MKDELVPVPLGIAFKLMVSEYMEDIDYNIHRLVTGSSMPPHLKEDIKQETLILLYERLATYDPSKSSLRTFIVRTTEIAFVRFRSSYFEMTTAPDFVIEQEEDTQYFDAEMEMRELGICKTHRDILMDKIAGYTFLEISERNDVSVRRIYEALEEVKDKVNKYQ